MKTETSNTPHLDHFFSASAARLDRWRELNAKAQAWAAEAQTAKARSGRAAVEAALAEVRGLEDFFAFPGLRLMNTLAERIASDDALGTGRLVRRLSGALLSGSYRNDAGEWESSDDNAGSVPATYVTLIALYVAIHYLFVSQSSQALALLGVFLDVGVRGGVPAPLIFATCYFSVITPQGGSQNIIFAASGYLTQRELYRLGLLTTLAFLAVFLVIGTPWVLFVTR